MNSVPLKPVGQSERTKVVRPDAFAKPVRNTAPPAKASETGTTPKEVIRLRQRLARLEQLLAFEAEIRSAENLNALRFVLANRIGMVLGAEQVVIWSAQDRRSPKSNKSKQPQIRIDSVSSVAEPDQNAPLVKWLGSRIGDHLDAIQQDEMVCTVPINGRDAPGRGYPLGSGLLVRLPLRSGPSAGFLLASTKPFPSADIALARRVAETAAHAWQGFQPEKRTLAWLRQGRSIVVLLVITLLVMCIPVPMSILAPAEVIARNPVPVTMPVQGVVSEVLVEPNMPVNKGDILLRLEQADFKNLEEAARQELAVAMARFRRASQSAFAAGYAADPGNRGDAAIYEAEMKLAEARLEHARQNRERTTIRAATDGVVVFTSRSDWLGRPVATGERVMEITNPDKTEIRVDVPIGDAIHLDEEAGVRFFSETRPLNPVAATPTAMSYKAMPTEAGPLAFRLNAVPSAGHENTGGERPVLRIGERGTAQVTSGTTLLGYFLFRKPLSKLRQWTGI